VIAATAALTAKRNNNMKSNHTTRLLGSAGFASLLTSALATLVAVPAHAQESGYYYGGLSVGQSRSQVDEERITANLMSNGLSTSAMDLDERGGAYKVFGGYQFNRHFGLEGGYFNLGKFGFNSTTVPAGSLDGRLKAQGLNLDLVGTLPLSNRLAASARVGVQYARVRDNFRGTGAVTVADPSPSKNAANFKIGAGLQYAFAPNFILRGEAERYRIDDAVGNKGDINVFLLSMVVPFGRAPSTAPRPAPAPAPVYQAPAAAPAPAVAAPPAPVAVAPAPRRVSFSADSLFSFDASSIRPEGKAALDTFARQLNDTRFDVITVEGHTDRLGSRAYNQRLSQKRAESVKAYLVSAGRLSPAKISTVGKGSSEPVTKSGDCVGSKRSDKLVSCLQPDRRVEVEVDGTRR
jgi:OOP family OmpA-OmpF porin